MYSRKLFVSILLVVVFLSSCIGSNNPYDKLPERKLPDQETFETLASLQGTSPESTLRSYTIVEDNSDIEGAEVLFFALEHYQVEQELELSAYFINTLYANFPNERFIVLFEGMQSGRYIEYDNPEDDYDLDYIYECCAAIQYYAFEEAADLAGWDNHDAWEKGHSLLEHAVEIIEEVDEVCDSSDSPLFVIESSDICKEWNQTWRDLEEIALIRNQSLADSIDYYLDLGYDKVIVTAGSLHWFEDNADIVRKTVRRHNYIVYTLK